jgi:TonB-linked SusC/RagA family outer membrane protein
MKNANQAMITVGRLLTVGFIMLFLSAFSLQAQNRKLSGKITDDKGEEMTGVTITVVGNNTGTATDMNGNYTIQIPKKAAIRISYIGYKTIVVTVPEDKTEMNISLEEDVILLKEAVVFAMDMKRDEKSIASAFQKIDIESMTESRDGNFLNMLAGKAAGLQVFSNGAPGTTTRVAIRGYNSLSGNNQPLYVIDGIPIVNNLGEDYGMDLDYGNPANSINPDDIESVTVLKGANASALYGSDAANGVIVITTKKATNKNGMGITFSSNLQFSKILQYPIYQNVYGTGNSENLNSALNYQGNNDTAYDPSLPWGLPRLTDGQRYSQRSWGLPMLGFDVVGRNGEVKPYSPHPDNVTSMYKAGQVWTNNVAYDKLSDAVSIRFSYTNAKTNDVLSNFNIINRNQLSLRTTAKLTNYLNIEANARYNNEEATNRGYRNASDKNPLYAMIWLPRDISESEMSPWKYPDGKSIVTVGGYKNPYWLLNELSNADEKNWLLMDATANISFTKDLKLRLRTASDIEWSQGTYFVNMYSPFDTDGEYQNFNEMYRNQTFEGLLSYNKRWKKFNLLASAGAWSQDYLRRKRKTYVPILLQPDDQSISNNGGTLSASEDYNAKKKQSLFGVLNIGYKDFTYLDLTARNDWSSTLPTENRSYFYSSAGLSFMASQVIKIPKKILSSAKLRFSVASVGNDAGFDQLKDGYSYGRLYLSDMPWFQSDNLKKNLQLKPEHTSSYEVGTDLRFWDSRINLDITHYSKSTTDQILQSTLSAASGYDRAMFNAGEVKNWGTEISLKIKPIQTKTFEWNTIINWSNNRSKIVSLASDMEYIALSRYSNKVEVRLVEGKPYGSIYGVDWLRDDQGRVLVKANGRTQETTEYQFLGNLAPDWIGGWINTFKIKNVDVSFLIDFRKGGLIWSATEDYATIQGQTVTSLEGRSDYQFSNWVLGENDAERQGFLQPNHTVNPGATYYTNKYYDNGRPKGITVPNAVYAEGDLVGQASTYYLSPVNYWYGSFNQNAPLYLYDASFIKLKEVSIGYNFPKSLLRHIPVFRTAKLSAVGRNLAILFQKTPTGVDPEAIATTSGASNSAQGVENGFNLPTMTFGFNFRATF